MFNYPIPPLLADYVAREILPKIVIGEKVEYKPPRFLDDLIKDKELANRIFCLAVEQAVEARFNLLPPSSIICTLERSDHGYQGTDYSIKTTLFSSTKPEILAAVTAIVPRLQENIATPISIGSNFPEAELKYLGKLVEQRLHEILHLSGNVAVYGVIKPGGYGLGGAYPGHISAKLLMLEPVAPLVRPAAAVPMAAIPARAAVPMAAIPARAAVPMAAVPARAAVPMVAVPARDVVIMPMNTATMMNALVSQLEQAMKTVADAVPVVSIARPTAPPSLTQGCSICLRLFSEVTKSAFQCGHVFCSECADTLYAQGRPCAVCRTGLGPPIRLFM